MIHSLRSTHPADAIAIQKRLDELDSRIGMLESKSECKKCTCGFYDGYDAEEHSKECLSSHLITMRAEIYDALYAIVKSLRNYRQALEDETPQYTNRGVTWALVVNAIESYDAARGER